MAALLLRPMSSFVTRGRLVFTFRLAVRVGHLENVGPDADSAHGGVFQVDKCSKRAKRREIMLHIWM